MKKIISNGVLVLVSLIVGLLAVEWAFRLMLFSDAKAFEKWREPGQYSDFYSEDLFWKLYYQWDGEFKPPDCVHPELGWINDFTRHSLLHWQMKYYSGKRPILLYGDSYAMGSPSAIPFQDILNNDTDFSKENYFYNYGVGGYGLDQIYLLFDKTYLHYEKPVVIFSLFVHDLDRTLLQVRTGQKPWFESEGDSLILHTDLNPNAVDYFEEHPPGAFSYLARKYLFSEQNILSEEFTEKLLGLSNVTEKKKAINGALLQKVVDDLKASNTDFVFLVFHTLHYDKPNFGPDAKTDWRNVFLKDFFKKNNVPFIWSKDLIANDNTYKTWQIEKYIIPGDGHPTTYFNHLIAWEIKKTVLSSPAKFKDRKLWDSLHIANAEKDTAGFIDLVDKTKTYWDYDFTYYKNYIFYLERSIRHDAGFMDVLKSEAVKQDKTIDQIVREFSFYLIWEIEKDCFIEE